MSFRQPDSSIGCYMLLPSSQFCVRILLHFMRITVDALAFCHALEFPASSEVATLRQLHAILP
jgi:hypothetical protein